MIDKTGVKFYTASGSVKTNLYDFTIWENEMDRYTHTHTSEVLVLKRVVLHTGKNNPFNMGRYAYHKVAIFGNAKITGSTFNRYMYPVRVCASTVKIDNAPSFDLDVNLSWLD